MTNLLRSIVLSLVSIAPFICQAETLTGRVVAVADGDTVTVLDAANAQHKIRVAGIDAPEKKQAFGQRSKQSMARMVFGKQVQVVWHKHDRYRRIIGKILVAQEVCQNDVCPKTLDAGLAQIAVGLAWHYKKYEREQSEEDRQKYAETELKAHRQKAGLWVDTNPVAPWEFRRKK